jgi:hypothetical protein
MQCAFPLIGESHRTTCPRCASMDAGLSCTSHHERDSTKGIWLPIGRATSANSDSRSLRSSSTLQLLPAADRTAAAGIVQRYDIGAGEFRLLLSEPRGCVPPHPDSVSHSFTRVRSLPSYLRTSTSIRSGIPCHGDCRAAKRLGSLLLAGKPLTCTSDGRRRTPQESPSLLGAVLCPCTRSQSATPMSTHVRGLAFTASFSCPRRMNRAVREDPQNGQRIPVMRRKGQRIGPETRNEERDTPIRNPQANLWRERTSISITTGRELCVSAQRPD